MLFFTIMAAPLEYVRPELFDEAVDRRAERHRLAERHRMLQARRRRPWRHRLPTSSERGWSGHLTPLTYDRDHTWAGARVVGPKRHRRI
jgi:hypothetical protein